MKILGIDYGRKKIGLAVGDSESRFVEPLLVLTSSKFKVPAFVKTMAGRQISKLISENNIETIVVGLPSGKIDEKVKTFGKTLGKSTGVPVEYFDETLTTKDAQKLLIASGRKRKSRREKEDAIAAAIMLESYLGRLR